ALQLVDDGKSLLTPFLPNSSQKVFELLGGEGTWADMPRIDEVTEGDGRPYPVVTGTYTGQAKWESAPIAPGTKLAQPTPLFAKIDPQAAEDELARLRGYNTEPAT
ncbi:MAG TPA: methionine--tRNA ligase, partial [Streptosporangiaceae bacterium]|nr:methionine--tRNA ligase [Streptosporangiaceae bacterium]